MKLLLDTHTLLWSIGDSSELSDIATDMISNLENMVNLFMVQFIACF